MLLWRYDIDVNVQACDGRRMITGAYGENALIEAVMYRRYVPVSFYNNKKDGISEVFYCTYAAKTNNSISVTV